MIMIMMIMVMFDYVCLRIWQYDAIWSPKI
jgi:hypothetical protein